MLLGELGFFTFWKICRAGRKLGRWAGGPLPPPSPCWKLTRRCPWRGSRFGRLLVTSSVSFFGLTVF